jgi:hypothetical protein
MRSTAKKIIAVRISNSYVRRDWATDMCQSGGGRSKQTSGTARMSTGSGVNTDGIVVVTSLRQ